MGFELTVMPFAKPMGAACQLSFGAAIDLAGEPLSTVETHVLGSGHEHQVFDPVVVVVAVDVMNMAPVCDRPAMLLQLATVTVAALRGVMGVVELHGYQLVAVTIALLTTFACGEALLRLLGGRLKFRVDERADVTA